MPLSCITNRDKERKKKKTSAIISKGSPNYIKNIQELYPVLNISSTGKVFKLSFDISFKSINMNDKLQKNKNRTKRRNKRKETLWIYTSQLVCTLAKTSTQSIPVYKMCHLFFFFHLLSLLDFSTDFLNFAEAIFAY